jgi:hypothetical protein
MSGKKTTPTSPTKDLPALRIGSRVRCTDGVEGRISWANAVSVKVKWADGEQVTWRRDSLAGRPIEILDAEAATGQDDQAEAPATASEQAASGELPQAETNTHPAAAELGSAAEVPEAEPAPAGQEQPQAPTAQGLPPAQEPTATADGLPATEPVAQEPPQAAPTDGGPEPIPAAVAKPKRSRKAPAEPKEKKVSALDAAARVLAEEGRPMSCKELIATMAAKGYWASPKGATPEATLYSAVLRELTAKGSAARFTKAERGKFARNLGA